MARVANEGFPIGSQAEAVQQLIVRQSEALDSPELWRAGPGQRFQVRARGADEAGVRLHVSTNGLAGPDGWVSCVAQSGRILLTPVPATPKASSRPFNGDDIGDPVPIAAPAPAAASGCDAPAGFPRPVHAAAVAAVGAASARQPRRYAGSAPETEL
eukprot:TRINITY_DN27560_c0_g1_i1.p1 TRINITY_DN27560_c0_g1~~TRINITY_DN27560_c0_g1_i1.p1  ORF type:complete len:157 (+),score=25.07 TRINITY_DN27560_c0_g1_i1:99-569(+)